MNALATYALAAEMKNLLKEVSIEEVCCYPNAVSIEISGSYFSFIHIVRLKNEVDIALSNTPIAKGAPSVKAIPVLRGAMVLDVKPLGFDRTIQIDLVKGEQWGEQSMFEMVICLIPHMASVNVGTKPDGAHLETIPLGSGRGGRAKISSLTEKPFSLLDVDGIDKGAIIETDTNEAEKGKQFPTPEHTLIWERKKKLAFVLTKNVSGIDPLLAAAIADRSEDDLDTTINILRELNGSIKGKAWHWHIYDFPNEGDKGKSVIYPFKLPIKLEGLAVGSVIEALQTRYANVTFPSYITLLKEKLIRSMQRELRKLKRMQLNLSQDIEVASKAKEFRHMGNLLATYRHLLRPGMKSITVKDLSGERNVTVTLDAAKPIDANIKDYFNRARKGERGIFVMRERNKQIEKVINRKKKLMAAVDDEMDATGIISAASSLLKTKKNAGKKTSTSGRFRVFKLDEIHKVLVGRNDKENDLLTHKYSSPKDLWFHAQGVSGSHVVLKGATSSTPKRIIEKAAEIAAYFSKARHSETVPVIYTEKRYVRKPRKSKAGTASVERGKTIFVSPRIPQKEKETDL